MGKPGGHDDGHRQQQQQQHQQHQQQERVIDHVNRVMDWAARLRVTPSPSFRCDALQVLAAGAAPSRYLAVFL